MCWQSETKLYNGSDKDVSASGGKLTKKESLKVKDLKLAPLERSSRVRNDQVVKLDSVLQIPELMSVCPRRLQVQKKNYREEKKRATKELLSTITDPSVIVMADWLKVGT